MHSRMTDSPVRVAIDCYSSGPREQEGAGRYVEVTNVHWAVGWSCNYRHTLINCDTREQNRNI